MLYLKLLPWLHFFITQQEPATHDLNSILEYKNKYMGNASNVSNLFQHLPLSNVGMNFELHPENLEIEVNYKDTVWNIGEEKVKSSLLYNSTAAFALIDNLKIIDYNFSGASYQVKSADVESLYSDFNNILEKENWSNYVQSKMNDLQYVEDTFLGVIKPK
ncbi:DUF4825 domain-containing protein [Bacillaceae bacterium S4-13-58]